jgi:hypothetical protein
LPTWVYEYVGKKCQGSYEKFSCQVYLIRSADFACKTLDQAL